MNIGLDFQHILLNRLNPLIRYILTDQLDLKDSLRAAENVNPQTLFYLTH